MSRGLIHRLHGVAQAAGHRLAATQPWLRMVSLTYAGAGALAAVGLVVTASITPVGRVVQQVAVPAQEAVTSATQSARGAIGGVFSVPGPRFFIPPRPAAVALPEPDNALQTAEPDPTEVVADAEAQPSLVQDLEAQGSDDQESATDDNDNEIETAQPVAVPGRSAVVFMDNPADADDASLGAPIEVDEDEAEPAPTEEPVEVVVEAPVMQAASQSTPKPLPTPTPLPETPALVKARMDAANQAAIDAEKAARARAKAEADAANEAAISGRPAPAWPTPTLWATPTPTTSSVSNPPSSQPASGPAPDPRVSQAVPVVQSMPTSQRAVQQMDRASSTPSTGAKPVSGVAAANAANDAAISAARTATADAKARAEAANQAAIAAARTGHATPTPTPRPAASPAPTPQPTASIPPTPTPQVDDTPATLDEQAASMDSDDEESPDPDADAESAPDTQDVLDTGE